MCPFSGWDTEGTVGGMMVSCPAAGEIIIWSSMLNSPSEHVYVFNFSIVERMPLASGSSGEVAGVDFWTTMICVVTHCIVDGSCIMS